MMGLAVETRRRLRETDSRWPIKFWLRVVASFFSLIGIILLAAAVSLWDKNFYYVDSVNSGDWSDGFPIAPLTVSILWNAVVIAYLFLLKKPIHPGAVVGVDLILWLAMAIGLIICVLWGAFWTWQRAIPDKDGVIICDWLNIWSRECTPVLYPIGNLEIAGIVFAGLSMVLHFVLFTWGCRETHLRRRRAREDHNIELQYHQRPEERQPLPPPAYQTHLEGGRAVPDEPATKYS